MKTINITSVSDRVPGKLMYFLETGGVIFEGTHYTEDQFYDTFCTDNIFDLDKALNINKNE